MSFLVGFLAGVPAHCRKGLVDFVGGEVFLASLAAGDGRTFFSWGGCGGGTVGLLCVVPVSTFRSSDLTLKKKKGQRLVSNAGL